LPWKCFYLTSLIECSCVANLIKGSILVQQFIIECHRLFVLIKNLTLREI
jgi:hypothetical protein